MINFENARRIETPNGEIAMIERGSEILFCKQKYKCEVGYLESTGTQYIKTGITATGNTRVVAKMESLGKNAAGRYAYLFASKSPLFSVRLHWSNGRPYNTYGSTQSIVFYCELNEPWEINYGAGISTFNDYKKELEYSEFSDGELQIFARNGSDRGNARTEMFQIYENETLVRDYIPVLDWNDVPCLYDKVSDELFYNQGTGEFIYGLQEVA